MFKRGLAAALAAAAIGGLGAPASAAVLYDSGGVPGFNVGGTGVSAIGTVGGRLVFGSDVTITDFEALMVSQDPAASEFGIRLLIKAEVDDLPGATIFSDVVTTPTFADGGAWTGLNGLNVALTAGAYWFTYEAVNGSLTVLQQSLGNPLARYAFISQLDYGSAWQKGGVSGYGFRVFGDGGGPVSFDEPWAQAPGAVPEPATWAMMILGFGHVGAALRRRQGAGRYAAGI